MATLVHTLVTGTGWHSVCSKANGAPFHLAGFTTSADDLLRLAHHEMAAGRDVWFGVHPLRERPSEGRGGAADVLEVRTLAADLDWNDPESHADPDLPTEGEVMATVHNLGELAPSVVVNSGHGLQAYWHLTSPVAPDEGATLTVRLHEHLGALGLRPERADLASVLRVPGTLNRKATPVLVEEIEAHADRRFTPEYLNRRLPRTAKRASRGGGR